MQLHVSCAIDCLFMCFLFWFLTLYVQYQSCLIFCSAFVYCLSDFLSKLLTFARLLFGRFCLGTTSAFSQFHLATFCFFLFYGLAVCFPLVMAICFVMLAQFSCFCYSTWFLLFLLVLYWVWINLNFLTLLIFLHYYIYLCILLLLWASAIATHPFFCHYSAPIIIPGHHNHPCQLTVFFCRDHACQNMSCSRICVSFWLISRSPLAHAYHSPHSQPIATHFCAFVCPYAWSPKTWCSGKFPRP